MHTSRFTNLLTSLLILAAMWITVGCDGDTDEVEAELTVLLDGSPENEGATDTSSAPADGMTPAEDVPTQNSSDTSTQEPSDAKPTHTKDILDALAEDVPVGVLKDITQDSVDDVADADSLPDGYFDPNASTEDEELFPLGVQSGDAALDGAVFWTRYLGSKPLRLVVFADGYKEKPGEIAIDSVVEVADGGFVHVEVNSLTSHTNYRYCFYEDWEAGGGLPARSTLGLLRTAPDPESMVSVVFGATSCINDNFMPYDTLEQAGSDDLDFFILAGDLVYADGSKTVEDYRTVWEEAFADWGYQKLFRTTPNFATWDDHEVDNNWNPETIGETHLEAATQVFFEVLATRLQPEPKRVWRNYRWGKAAEVFILDCRSERRPSEGLYISEEQMAWLKEGLASSDAVFKIIVNSVPITDMPVWFVAENDRWEGHPAQREEILDFIEEEVEGVLWVTGDFHFGGVMKVGPPGSPYENMTEVMVGPAAQFANPLWVGVRNSPSVKGQFPFLTGTLNYTRFTLNPAEDPPSIIVEFLTGSGSVIHSEVLVP